MPPSEISVDVLEAVTDIIAAWGVDAGSRLAGLHCCDRARLTEAIRGVLWKSLNDHALFLRELRGKPDDRRRPRQAQIRDAQPLPNLIASPNGGRSHEGVAAAGTVS